MPENNLNPRTAAGRVAAWMRFCEQNNLPVNSINAAHSALLVRFLEGKDPLPVPPPKAYSCPWYEIAETIPFNAPVESHVYDGNLYINQSQWQYSTDRVATHERLPGRKFKLVARTGGNAFHTHDLVEIQEADHGSGI